MTDTKIMIVEDEAVIAMLLEKLLEVSGYAVAGPVANGEDAIRLAGSESPDLILMDIRIEGSMDGIDTTIKIHEQYDIPVVFLTAHSDSDTYERAMKTEPYGFLLKPLRRDELKSAIDTAIQKHEGSL
ncbi:response regulator [Methanogenium cariaci]|jgi:two-component system, response regulator PdtaR